MVACVALLLKIDIFLDSMMILKSNYTISNLESSLGPLIVQTKGKLIDISRLTIQEFTKPFHKSYGVFMCHDRLDDRRLFDIMMP